MSILSELYKDGDVLNLEHCQDLLIAAVLDAQLDNEITVDETQLLLNIMDSVAIKSAGDEHLVMWEPSYEYH